MKVEVYIRIVITIMLLGVVWRNAHWSIAVALTLLAIRTELDSLIIINKLTKVLRLAMDMEATLKIYKKEEEAKYGFNVSKQAGTDN